MAAILTMHHTYNPHITGTLFRIFDNTGYLLFSVKDRINFDLSPKRKQIFCLFHAFNPLWEKLYQNPVQFFSIIPRGVPIPHSNALQYYVKHEKCKVNDVIFPSGCEARAINLGNKNMKIGIFPGGTSVRLKNIFTDISLSRYPSGKHEIKCCIKLYLSTIYMIIFRTKTDITRIFFECISCG